MIGLVRQLGCASGRFVIGGTSEIDDADPFFGLRGPGEAHAFFTMLHGNIPQADCRAVFLYGANLRFRRIGLGLEPRHRYGSADLPPVIQDFWKMLDVAKPVNEAE